MHPTELKVPLTKRSSERNAEGMQHNFFCASFKIIEIEAKKPLHFGNVMPTKHARGARGEGLALREQKMLHTCSARHLPNPRGQKIATKEGGASRARPPLRIKKYGCEHYKRFNYNGASPKISTMCHSYIGACAQREINTKLHSGLRSIIVPLQSNLPLRKLCGPTSQSHCRPQNLWCLRPFFGDRLRIPALQRTIASISHLA